ncbi:MAG: hypothetical protein KJ060_04695, partial [Candidatus Hydrogenedentes bacterium]|nr:hypothetical protein [Candidatus Hydrogenedentota bacterium]
VVDLLELMPESAVTAIATPSIRDLEDRAEAFLVRASPESINMEAEIAVIVQQLGQALQVPNARTLDDIAFEKGFDSERPMALFVRAEHPSQIVLDRDSDIARPDPGAAGWEALPSITDENFLESAALAVYVLDSEIAEQSVQKWFGDAASNPDEVEIDGIRVHSKRGEKWAYFFHDDVLVFGADTIVAGIVDCVSRPTPIRYGSADCPADPTDTLIQITRLDRLDAASRYDQNEAASELPDTVAGAATEVLDSLRTLIEGQDPLICIYRVTDSKLDVLARLDREKYPAIAELRGPTRGLTHLGYLPEDSVAVLSWRFDGTLREMVLNALQNALANDAPADTPFASMQNSLGETLQLLQGDMTLAVAGDAAGKAKLMLLADVSDGDRARAQLRAAGLMPIVSETYNGVDICLLPIPVPTGDGLSYALPENTLVLSTDLARLKTLIDSRVQGPQTQWGNRLDPALPPDAPMFTALVVDPEALGKVVLPELTARQTVDPASAELAETAWQNIRELRYTSQVNGIWQEGRLTVTAK